MCQGHDPISADAVVLASGGLSVPNTGSDGRGLQIAQRLGHVVHQPYAALTPLTATADAPFAHLSGVSLPVTITSRSNGRKAKASGGFLFTHRGYSGPAVLDVSHVAVRSMMDAGAHADVMVQWSDRDESAWNAALQVDRSAYGGGRNKQRDAATSC